MCLHEHSIQRGGGKGQIRPREGRKHIRGGDGGRGRDSTGGRGRDSTGGGGRDSTGGGGGHGAGGGGGDGGRNSGGDGQNKREKSPMEQPPTRPLLMVNGPLNGHLLLSAAPAHITGD